MCSIQWLTLAGKNQKYMLLLRVSLTVKKPAHTQSRRNILIKHYITVQLWAETVSNRQNRKQSCLYCICSFVHAQTNISHQEDMLLLRPCLSILSMTSNWLTKKLVIQLLFHIKKTFHNSIITKLTKLLSSYKTLRLWQNNVKFGPLNKRVIIILCCISLPAWLW